MENSKQIDIEAVKERLECDDDFLVEIWVAFKEEVVNLQLQLAKAIETGDMHAVEHLAHSLKGMSANIGAEILQSEAYEMEQASKIGNIDKVKGTHPQLVETIRLVNAEIEGLI